MNDNGKLYERLRKMNVPPAANPEHQAALRRRLERLAAEDTAPADRRGFFSRRPLLAWSGVLASAAVLLLGVYLVIRTFVISGPEIARANGGERSVTALLSFQTGDLTVVRGGVRTQGLAGDRLGPADTVLTAAGAAGLLQIGDSILTRIDSRTVLSLPEQLPDDPARPLTLTLAAGRAAFVVHGSAGRGLAVATPVATFITRGTVFTVVVDGDRGSVLSVNQGQVIVLAAAPATRVLRERVSAGETVAVDHEGGVKAVDRIDPEVGREVEILRQHSLIIDKDNEKSVPVTLVAVPHDAIITLGTGLRATGRLSLLVPLGQTFTCSVARPGYVTRTEEVTADRQKTVTVALVKQAERGGPDEDRLPTPALMPATPVPTEPPVRGRWADRTAVPVPLRAAALTGKAAEWTGIAPVLVDPLGDAAAGGPGVDMEAVHMARTADVLFIGVKFAGGTAAGDLEPECVLTLTAENGEQLTVTARSEVMGVWRARAAGNMIGDAPVDITATADGSLLTLAVPLPATLRAPGAKAEAGLSLTVQKYGRLRVVSDTTNAVLIGM